MNSKILAGRPTRRGLELEDIPSAGLSRHQRRETGAPLPFQDDQGAVTDGRSSRVIR